MLNTLKKRIKNEKGLSLVELLAVIVILGIVAAIAIPAIGNIITNSKVKAEISDAIQVMNAANIYFTDNPTLTEFKIGDAGDYVESSGKLTDFTVAKGSTKDGVKTLNTIKFKGTQISTEISGKTLSDLSNAKVSKGEITWPTPPKTGE